MEPLFSKYLICLKCGGALKDAENVSKCIQCGKEYKTSSHRIVVDNDLDKDIEMSKNKWDEFYVRHQDQYLIGEKRMVGFQDLINEGIDLTRLNKESVFLEIGCGPFIQGRILAEKCKVVIGVDYSKKALDMAEEMFKRQGLENYILVQADVVNLPLKNECIDFAYGGGVVEHIEEIQRCIKELGRVVKKGGCCFNSVPIVNIGSLTYRQLWGNIPDIPILKHIYKFVHFKLLKTKLPFGYERSYRVGAFKKWHYQAGFKKIEMARFALEPQLHYVPAIVRSFASRIARSSILFWPMASFIAIK